MLVLLYLKVKYCSLSTGDNMRCILIDVYLIVILFVATLKYICCLHRAHKNQMYILLNFVLIYLTQNL